MCDYNFWANRQVWECVKQLTDEQFLQELDYSHGSIYLQSLHIMSVESWWFHFLKTGELVFLEPEDYPDRASISLEWDHVETEVRAYLNTLTAQELEREVRPEFWEEGQQPIKVWEAIFQVLNHSTDHRAQILSGLKQLNAPTIGQDFLDYLFAKQEAAGA